MDDGLLWLGLTRDEARVFQTVVELQETSSSDLATVLMSSASAISRAVAALRERGLVQMTPHRRPGLVFLDPDAPAVLQGLREQAQGRAEIMAGSLAETEALVADAARIRRERGRPFYERSGRIWQMWHQERVGATSHDEVHVIGSPRRIGRTGRLLVTNSADLQALLPGQSPGTEIRCTTESLPRLMILDGERVAAEASTVDGVRTFWSHDARHVRAAQELFGLWWDRAGAGVTKSAAGSEAPLDEWEEWQGLEPDDPLALPDAAC